MPLQEFDIEIRDKRNKNLVVNHLSRLLVDDQKHDREDIREEFLDEHLLLMTFVMTPWCADIMNYLVSGYVPQEFNSQQRKRFFYDSNNYY